MPCDYMSLGEMLSNSNDAISALQKKNDELMHENSNLKETYDIQLTVNKSLAEMINTQSKELDVLREESYYNHAVELTAETERLEAENKKLAATLKQRDLTIERLSTQHAILTQNNTDLKATNKRLADRDKYCTDTINALNHELEYFRAVEEKSGSLLETIEKLKNEREFYRNLSLSRLTLINKLYEELSKKKRWFFSRHKNAF